jgi:hypothetical protein
LVAKALRADLLITNREMSVDPTLDYWNTSVLSPANALPLIGLYLRTQGKFILFGRALGSPWQGTPTTRERSWFYWLAAKDLVRGAERWRSALDAYQAATGDDRLDGLGTGLFWRVDQLLRSRDRLLAALSVPATPGIEDPVATELDLILVFCMAAFDIVARIAHAALDVDGELRYAGWHYSSWVGKLGARDPTLADIVRGDSEGQNLLKIVSGLRNMIHGEPVSSGVTVPLVGDDQLQVMVKLPSSCQSDVLGAMSKLGGHGVWGVRDPFKEKQPHLHVGVFVEKLLPIALSVLNSLAAAIPVEGLPGTPPLTKLSGDLFRGPAEHRTQWQLGIDV